MVEKRLLSSMENEAIDARSSLAAVDQARAAAADRLITPGWYHPVLGLLTAGFLVAMVLGDIGVQIVALLVFSAGTTALVAAYKRVTGVWIDGFRAGPATRWSVTMGVILALVALGAFALHRETGDLWPVWMAGALAVVLVMVFGTLFDRSVRKGLRAGTITLPERP